MKKLASRMLWPCIAVTVAVSCIVAAGCLRQAAKPAGTPPAQVSGVGKALQHIGAAPAAPAVSDPMRPFFSAGLGFIALGGILVCFGGRGTGLLLMGLGVGTTATGVLFVQFPWAALILALAAGLFAAIIAYDRIRVRRQLATTNAAVEITTEVIQNVPEGKAIKEGISFLGEKAEETVRAVVTPIKKRLAKEGKI